MVVLGRGGDVLNRYLDNKAAAEGPLDDLVESPTGSSSCNPARICRAARFILTETGGAVVGALFMLSTRVTPPPAIAINVICGMLMGQIKYQAEKNRDSQPMDLAPNVLRTKQVWALSPILLAIIGWYIYGMKQTEDPMERAALSAFLGSLIVSFGATLGLEKIRESNTSSCVESFDFYAKMSPFLFLYLSEVTSMHMDSKDIATSSTPQLVYEILSWFALGGAMGTQLAQKPENLRRGGFFGGVYANSLAYQLGK
jgi:xanthosine utilization system XapX-like protein